LREHQYAREYHSTAASNDERRLRLAKISANHLMSGTASQGVHAKILHQSKTRL
jgi:hypothetical protein